MRSLRGKHRPPEGCRQWRRWERLRVGYPLSCHAPHRATPTPSRSQFLEELEARMRVLSAEDLRAAILGGAERLASPQRRDLLAMFPEAAPTGRPLSRPGGVGTDSDLIGDIDAFIADL